METTASRITGIVVLALLVIGAYALISAGSTVTSGPAANGKFQVLKKPPTLTGEVQEGTGI